MLTLTTAISVIEQLIASYPGFAFCKDTSSTIISGNTDFAAAAGYKTGSELAGKTDEDLVWARFADIYRAGDREACSGHFFKTIEPFMVNSQLVTIFCRKMPLRDEKKNIIGLIGYGELIDSKEFARKSHVAELMEATRQYKLIGKADLRQYFNGLSVREAECLFYFLRGFTMQKISKVLQLSERTVESYLGNAKIKFACKNKSELIQRCFANGFVYFMPESLQGREPELEAFSDL